MLDIPDNKAQRLKSGRRPVDNRIVALHDDDATQAELARAYAGYRAAMTGWRAASKAGDAETAERAADRLLQARVELYRSLVASGWQPPPTVVVQLDRDAALVAAPSDFDALLGV